MRALDPHTTGFVDRPDARLHYEVFGAGPRTILFVPTWALIHSRCWKGQVPYFAQEHRVVTYDPRGNGLSSRPETEDGYALDRIIEDVPAVMDALGIERAVLVGFSFSSAISFAVAATLPDRVEAVVSIGAWTPIVPPYEHRAAGFEEDPGPEPEGWNKYNAHHWRRDYRDFAEFFLGRVQNEPHSTKQREDAVGWAMDGDPEMLLMTQARAQGRYAIDDEMYGRVRCPSLIVVGGKDEITPPAGSRRIAELTGGELHEWPEAGHGLHGRFPARFNVTMRDFLARHLGAPRPTRKATSERRALVLSSPIGLGHARRDLAIARELRRLQPDLKIDWLAQDPVTRLLAAEGEAIHPASARLASESAHIEAEAGAHELNAFQAIRSMDEILALNFVIFQEALEETRYEVVIADEAWDVDHHWHEHPELKKAPVAWLTDFVGFVPFEANGPHEAALTTDYNAEMIEHVEGRPDIRDRAIFVGTPEDVADLSLGDGLPMMRDWVPRHYDFADYILGRHPSELGTRDELRARFGYDDGRPVCIVAVGGSGVGAPLIRRILTAVPLARERIPELRVIVVTGPRLDPALFDVPTGVEMRAFVPDLDAHLAACDLALVQGGLTTCMELTAAGTPFLYFPLKNHFEQNFHVAARLDRYGAGRRMTYAETAPEDIARAMLDELQNPRRPLPVAAGGAARAAAMIADVL